MALSDSPRISGKTKERVRAAAKDLGYVASSAGRALRLHKSDALVLIVPHSSQHVFGHAYFMKVLTGMSEVCTRRDTQVIISTSGENSRGIAAYDKVMQSRSADGAIVTSAAVWDENIRKLAEGGIPTVLIGNFPHLTDAVSVGINDISASELITKHLIDVHGRKALIHVTGPLDHQAGIDRQTGFLNACDKSALSKVCKIIEGDFSEESGAKAVQHLLETGFAFDGIVFANDEMAFGGLSELRARGVEIPGAVSIVGFDDFGMSRITSPSITTINVPAEEMAAIATERLFEIINGISPEPSHQEIPVSLVIRESCGCTQEVRR